MMIEEWTAHLALQAGDRIGESPVWDQKHQRILWIDHEQGVIHAAREAEGRLEDSRWPVNRPLPRPLAAAIPCATGGLIACGGREFFRIDEAGCITPFARLEKELELVTLNDAKCDRQGRLWAGTRATDRDLSPIGSLYRIDPDGVVTQVLQHMRLPNGLDWSPDGKTFYLIDSVARSVEVFDFDPVDGTIGNHRTRTLDWGPGAPNGMTVDRDGDLWVAVTGGGEVRRYAPDGALRARVRIATAFATSCAFGGPENDVLFITSRRGRAPDIALKMGVAPERMEDNSPAAGGLFVCQPGAGGVPATLFAA